MNAPNDNNAQERRAWELLGAQDLQLVIQPLHVHTISGHRVRISTLAVGVNPPALVGTVFFAVNKVDMRWSLNGDVVGDARPEYAIGMEYAALLRSLSHFTKRIGA